MIPVYLYIGPEFGQRNDAIEKHKIEAEKKFGVLDYHLLYAQDISLGEVLALSYSLLITLLYLFTCVIIKPKATRYIARLSFLFTSSVVYVFSVFPSK